MWEFYKGIGGGFYLIPYTEEMRKLADLGYGERPARWAILDGTHTVHLFGKATYSDLSEWAKNNGFSGAVEVRNES